MFLKNNSLKSSYCRSPHPHLRQGRLPKSLLRQSNHRSVEEKPTPQEEEKPPPPEPKAREQLPEQIVSPPDQVNDQIPEKTRLLSDRNSTAKEETVARGFPRPSSKEPPPVKKVPEQPKEPVEIAKKASEKPPLVTNKPEQPHLPAQGAKSIQKARPLPQPAQERPLVKQEPAQPKATGTARDEAARNGSTISASTDD